MLSKNNGQLIAYFKDCCEKIVIEATKKNTDFHFCCFVFQSFACLRSSGLAAQPSIPFSFLLFFLLLVRSFCCTCSFTHNSLLSCLTCQDVCDQ